MTTQEVMQNVAMLLAPQGGGLFNVIDIYESGLPLGSLVNTLPPSKNIGGVRCCAPHAACKGHQ